MPGPLRESPYGYTPTEYVCILFVVLFSISTILHAGQATYYRLWWLFPTACLAGVLEIAGWSAGRLWSAITPHIFESYEVQIVCTILGPTPLAAANFIILGHIITRLGPVYSRLSPKLYTTLFLCCDVISLVVQGIGGGMAAGAVNRRMNPAKGGHVMLGGIVFQTLTITAYVICAGEFLLRYLKNRPIASRAAASPPPSKVPRLTPRMKLLVGALVFNTTCLFIRAVYRVIELSDGWTGRIIHTQVYFNVLDGAMITLAMFTLNFVHPGAMLETRGGTVADIESEDGEVVEKA
ncbi:RTA1 like protein-domain-containing protein [Mycena epipterygia]|nr:RTA1 like protein-domain-containing protein [Mycena epipterygia]